MLEAETTRLDAFCFDGFLETPPSFLDLLGRVLAEEDVLVVLPPDLSAESF